MGARRTQGERAAETRQALIDAAIRLLHRDGYGGTKTERIAGEAGVSRGALQYHFPTRSHLMAAVVVAVHEDERTRFRAMIAAQRGRAASEWPDMLWEVLSRPSSLAVLEILSASRSDPELAGMIAPVQARLEQIGSDVIRELFGDIDGGELLATERLFVWAVRGLSIASVLVSDPAEIRASIAMFRRIVLAAEQAGVLGVHTPAD